MSLVALQPPEVVCSDLPSSGREQLGSAVLSSLVGMGAFPVTNYLLKGGCRETPKLEASY